VQEMEADERRAIDQINYRQSVSEKLGLQVNLTNYTALSYAR